MKKFLALFLVLAMAFSCILISCGKTDKDEDPDSSDDDDFLAINTNATTAGSTTTGNPSGPASSYTWTDVDETVYVTVAKLTVRSDTIVNDSTYKATANFGESYKRIKYNAQWSLIDYKGSQYYVSSKYVTTDDGSITFSDTAETTIYANVEKTLNLRFWTDASDDTNIGAIVKRGAELKQTGVSKNGNWVRVKFEDQTLYCSSAFVSTTKPSDETTAGGNNGPAQLG